MNYDEIAFLRSNHPTWRLLRADNAPLILGFLGRVFVEANASRISSAELVEELDNELFRLNTRLGEATYPKRASAYLDDWASPTGGWLRKFYLAESDDPYYDLQPAVEKAISFAKDLQSREFVGTESRLTTIVVLLREMVSGADDDVDRRLGELKERRAVLDAQIQAAERGEIVVLDDTALRDRFQQVSRMTRELLSDFREVEDNFRQLDRNLREQIAGWTGSKGDLLDEVFGNQNSITESDQGRSFQAFYDFLLSRRRQDELAELLSALGSIEALGTQPGTLRNTHFDWIDASERTQATVRLLSDQLRRFLDDQVWLENRRVVELLRDVEAKALQIKQLGLTGTGTDLDALAPSIDLPFERPLYRRTRTVGLNDAEVALADTDIDTAPLFDQLFVDSEALIQNVHDLLGPGDQVALQDILASRPLTQGLAELVGYLALNAEGLRIDFDEDRRDAIEWENKDSVSVAHLPAVTYRKSEGDGQ